MKTIFLIILNLVACLASAQTGYFVPSDQFSSGSINHIYQDKYGFVWISTEYGLNRFDGYRFETFLHSDADSTTVNSNVIDCVMDSDGRQLWVATDKGLDLYDYCNDQFKHYPFPDGVTPRVTKLIKWHDGRIMLPTAGYGLYYLDDHYANVYKIDGGYTTKIHNKYFNAVFEDSKHRIWKIGFNNQLTVYQDAHVTEYTVNSGNIIHITEHNGEIIAICTKGVSVFDGDRFAEKYSFENQGFTAVSVFEDKDGGLYIGTRGEGLYYLDRNFENIRKISFKNTEINLNSAHINYLYQDNNGLLWIGCKSKGILVLKLRPPAFEEWTFSSQGLNISTTASSVCENGDTIWTAVPGSGVYGFDRKGQIIAHPDCPDASEFIFKDPKNRFWICAGDRLYAFNPKTGKCTPKISYSSDRFNTMTGGGDGRLYISAFARGFLIYDPANGNSKIFNSLSPDANGNKICNNWIMSMAMDSDGMLWIATSSGVSCFDTHKELFVKDFLKGVMCHTVLPTNRGHVLIGTDAGLYICEKDSPTALPFREGDGLRNKTVGKIIETAKGDFWCSTTEGLWRYNVDNKEFTAFTAGNGLTAKEYINCVGISTEDGRIIFANNNGLTVFHPDKITIEQPENLNLRLTGFKISGKTAYTDIPVVENDYYQVSYLDNNLSFEFSLLDFDNPRSVIYEYRVNNDVWIRNQEGINTLQFSHLQSGTYNLEVRALVSGKYSDPRKITLQVTPPWYRSGAAQACYAILLVGILTAAALLWKRRQNRQLDDEKMKFLINATHDIRSPLTIILGAIKKLKEKYGSDESTDAALRNAKRLEQLVTQILDTRKIDKKQMTLHCEKTDLVEYTAAICRLYDFNAKDRGISFRFDGGAAPATAWIDRVNFDKVISNLISNAFKYTPQGGSVDVAIHDNTQNIEIQVIDSGSGIDPQDTEKIFDRFYQSAHSASGTGIGLNLCREITLLHGGKITAANRTDGITGAVFTVALPKGNTHLKPEQIVIADNNPTTDQKSPSNSIKILIADDDKEIADYIISELSGRYTFDYAPDGKQALKKILANHYDLIISDVVMPEMDGIALLKLVKENPMVSQIPVVMLTSKISIENRLLGIKTGADAYIPKPFEMEELEAQIDNIVANIRRLKGKFSGAVSQEERVENIEIQGNNDALMERVMKVVNANLSNPDFNIDVLAQEAGISRANLYRKIKEITGISSGKFLRNLRMEQAARLLKEGKVDVNQIAEHVGYIDPAHFSNAFKAHFGLSPSEYQQANKG